MGSYSYNPGEKQVLYALIIINIICLAYFFYVFARRVILLKHKYFKNFWGILSLISNGLNIAVFVLLFKNVNPEIVRRIESFAVILMWMQLMYYLRLFP